MIADLIHYLDIAKDAAIWTFLLFCLLFAIISNWICDRIDIAKAKRFERISSGLKKGVYTESNRL